MKARVLCGFACVLLVASSSAFGVEVLRLNFDESPVDVVAIPYMGGPADIIPAGTVIDCDDITNGRPQECGSAQGAGCPEPWVDVSPPSIAVPAAPGPQGGNVLFFDQEDLDNPQGEGLFVFGLPPMAGAWTVEVIFMTTDPLNTPGMEYDIQDIIGTEGSSDTTPNFMLRIFGAGLGSLGLDATGQIQSGDLSGGTAFDGPDLEGGVWYHAAMVYDGAGTITGYLDDEMFGSSTVNHTGLALDMLSIGYFSANNDTPGQSIRGLCGEMDAVSVSNEALGAGSFRLLAGGSSVDGSWELY
ncbi:MAG: LamG-like jellyroll fold domain-containing protein [bacterium]